ncbi:MAG: hypothetical protein ABL921_18790 [Pirellula sp.]
MKSNRAWEWKPLTAACIAVASFLVSASPSSAQQSDTMRSVKLAPMDVDFYYGAYNMREQWRRFVSGPVAREAMQLAVVDRLSTQFRNDWQDRQGIATTARMILENGNFKSFLAFVQELASNDAFMLGDKQFSEWLEASGKLNDELGPLLRTSNSTAGETGKAVFSKWLAACESLNAPTFIMGARCDNEDFALEKIDMIEAAIQLGLSSELAPFLSQLRRIDDARGNRLQLVLRGTMIPWDSIPSNESFDETMKEHFRKFIEQKSIALTLGMFDGNFIFATSSTPEALLLMGKGRSIVDHPEMQIVRDQASRTVTSVAYVSDAFSQANFNASYKNFFSRLFLGNGVQLLQLFDGKPEIRTYYDSLLKDLQWADESIAKHLPEFKGMTSVSYLTNDGWERHDLFRTKNVLLDAASPLLSLEHVGPDPMLMVSTKFQDHPEYFQLVRNIVQRLKRRFDEAMELDWSDLGADLEDTNNFKKQLDIAWPFVVRLADAWEKKFIPGLSGEHAVVIGGGNLASKQWVKDMPMAAELLPLPGIATVSGVKNKALLKSGFEDVFAICDDIVKTVKENHPNTVPAGYQIPRPTNSPSAMGEKFSFPIPGEYSIPAELTPHALFAGSFLFGSCSDKQSEALANVSKLQIGQGVIDPQAKQSSAAYVHVGRLFEFVRPWFRYSLTESIESLDDNLFEDMIDDVYLDYDITGKELLSTWSVLSRIGEFSSSTTETPSGGINSHSVYRSQKAK